MMRSALSSSQIDRRGLCLPSRRACHVIERHLPIRIHTCQSQCAARSNSKADKAQSRVLHLLAAVAFVELLSTTSTLPATAQAWTHEWKPRRHHRRLGESGRSPDLGKYAPERLRRNEASTELPNDVGPLKDDGGLWSQLGSVTKSLQSALSSQQQRVEDHRQEQQWQSAATQKRTGFSPLVAAGLLVVLFLLGRWLVGVLPLLKWGGEKRQGRYVRDRSMGGKMVFVPDVTPGSPKQISNTSTGSGVAPVSVSGRRASADPWQAAVPRTGKEEELPAWWVPTHSIFIDAAYKQEAQLEAQALVNRMLNSKVSGQDYDLSNFVSLRALCGETGVVVDAKAQRESLYRSACELAATCCEEQTNRLGGQTAGKFLSGLASDLGIAQGDAINMVNGVVAKRSKQVLITACASYREEKNNEVLMELLKLAGLTSALPLPEHSAQAEMVAAGIQQSATLPERQAIFLTYGCMDQAGASRIAEMLGFQPALVLPQLQKHIVEGSKASQEQ